MPIIPPIEERFICDACGKEVVAFFSEYGDKITDDKVILCSTCKTKGLIWAAKQALAEEVKNV